MNSLFRTHTEKYASRRQSISMSDLWFTMLAKRLFSRELYVVLSSQVSIENNNYPPSPLPNQILSSGSPGENSANKPYPEMFNYMYAGSPQ